MYEDRNRSTTPHPSRSYSLPNNSQVSVGSPSSSLFDMGRGRALFSAFPREMLDRFCCPKIMQQSLLTLVAVADHAEAELFATARSASSNMLEWLCDFQDLMYLLEEVLYQFSLGEANEDADSKPAIEFILRGFETITNQKHLLFQTEKQGETRSSHKVTVFGRDQEKNEMVDFLLSDDRLSGTIGKASVLAVVGDDDGIAKTTLVDHIYHDDRVEACFELRGWVEFHQELDAESLAKIILDSLNEDFGYGDSLIELMSRLRECLRKRKKLLLVLNGFRSLAGWETLQTCFVDAAGRGSAIIFVMQQVDVAIEMLSDHVLHLDSSSSLLSDHVFRDENQVQDTPTTDFRAWTKPQVANFINLLHLQLRFLEYLDLSFSGIHSLPDSMSALSRLLTLKLSFCRNLRKLPSTLVDLVSLQYLDIRGTNLQDISLKLGRLKNLQMLIGFTVNSNSGSNLTELASISNIQTLSITELQNMADAAGALEVNLKEKRQLENLALRWNQLRVAEREQALEYLEPPKQLKMCYIP